MINRNPNHLKEVVDILKDYHIEKYVVLIGSWCELFYQEILDSYEANIRTTDIDFYYHEMKKPNTKLDFIKTMEKHGFFFDESNCPPRTKFFSNELEIEFLTRTTRNMNPTEKIEPLNVYAECLSECEMFGDSQNVMTCYLEKYDIEMQIPTPVAYCMHKILINDARKPEKQLKDKESIYKLISFIEYNDKYIEDWKRIYTNFSKKEKKRFKNNLHNLNLERLFDIIDEK